MWTATTRAQHPRAGLRCASDVTDAERCILEALLPGPARRGRRWVWPLREVINAIFHVLRTGCAWRLLPESFPPWPVVYRWFARLRDGGMLESVNHHLVMLDRERCGRIGARLDRPRGAVGDAAEYPARGALRAVLLHDARGNRGTPAQARVEGRRIGGALALRLGKRFAELGWIPASAVR
jgi:transposase